MIFLLRDGRDVVDSWLDAHRPGAWALDEGAYPVAHEGREALIRWQASVWTYRTGVVLRAYRVTTPGGACWSATRTSGAILPGSSSGSALGSG